METITIPKIRFEEMKREIKTLRNSRIYIRLLEFERNVLKKRYTRKDLGFSYLIFYLANSLVLLFLVCFHFILKNLNIIC